MADLPEFSQSVKRCYGDAIQRAQSSGRKMGASHFLVSILQDNDNSIFPFVSRLGTNPDKMLKKAKARESHEPKLGSDGAKITQEVVSAVSSASQVMARTGDTRAGMEVMLASFALGDGAIAELLNSSGVSAEAVVKAVADVRTTRQEEDRQAADSSVLDKYGMDLTARAKEGKIDPVIGRDAETRRVMQILARRTKNNPVVVGDGGVGKALTDSTLVPSCAIDGTIRLVRHGDLRVGDVVFNRSGFPVEVIGVYPQGELPVFMVETVDGRTVQCSGDHLWTVFHKGVWQTVDTLELSRMDSPALPAGSGWKSARVNKQDGLIDDRMMFALGVLYSSGDISQDTAETVAEYQDACVVADVLDAALTKGPNSDSFTFQREGASGDKPWFASLPLLSWRDVALMVTDELYGDPWEDIVDIVQSGSFRQRMAFLSGVMSSGTQYTGDDPVIDRLLCSCGATPGDIPETSWGFVDVEELDEHCSTVEIKQVTAMDFSLPMTCIMVDDPEHVYQTAQGIVTHNTAIVEGLARRVASGDCPEQLRGKTVYSLDIASLTAGAKYAGELEERTKEVLKEIDEADGKIITFIDEIHMIASGGSSSPMTIANMMKPMLARGQLRLIGATTPSEYRQFIEKDPALDRRFQLVDVAEPSVDDTIGILRGIKEKYENHHGIRIQDSALISCAELSKKYISGRFLPDKAIDLMDEAASRLKMLIDSRPEIIDELEQSIRSLEIERLALGKEDPNDPKISTRLDEVSDQLAGLQERLSVEKSQWENTREATESIRTLKQKLTELQEESEKYEQEGDFASVSTIRYDKIPEVQQALEQTVQDARDKGVDMRVLDGEVTSDVVADVVSAWTGVSAAKMTESETQRVLTMADKLSERVVGQPEAVNVLSQAIKKSKAGVVDPNRPIGSFMFAGNSGTGKTELSKALAEFLYDDTQSLITYSMEEYSDSTSVNKLVGSPAGYVGYEDTPALEKVRQRPGAVVLFDELEKADHQVISTLLGILEEGNITLSNGKEVDFSNTVIIFTTNIGAGLDKEGVLAQARAHFRPEFLNRLDAIVPFNALGIDALRKVVDIQVSRLQNTMRSRSITFETTDRARDWIAHAGYDPAFGARPVRRIVTGDVSDMLADDILQGMIVDGDHVTIDVVGVSPDGEGGRLVLRSDHDANDTEEEPETTVIDEVANQDSGEEFTLLDDMASAQGSDDDFDDLDALFGDE